MLALLWPRVAADRHSMPLLRVAGRRFMYAGLAVFGAALIVAVIQGVYSALAGLSLPALKPLVVFFLEAQLWFVEDYRYLWFILGSVIPVHVIIARNTALLTGLVARVQAESQPPSPSASDLREAVALYRANKRVIALWGGGVLLSTLALAVLALPARALLTSPPVLTHTMLGMFALVLGGYSLVGPVLSGLLPLEPSLREQLAHRRGRILEALEHWMWSEDDWSLNDRGALLTYLVADWAGRTAELRKLVRKR